MMYKKLKFTTIKSHLMFNNKNTTCNSYHENTALHRLLIPVFHTARLTVEYYNVDRTL